MADTQNDFQVVVGALMFAGVLFIIIRMATRGEGAEG